MIIENKTKMILFRFGYNWTDSFVDEHMEIIRAKGYVWFLKTGKIASKAKLDDVLRDGGFILFKGPKGLGNSLHLGSFTEMSMNSPEDSAYYPSYYKDVQSYSSQWFKVLSLQKIDPSYLDSLILTQTGKPLASIIDKTSSSFMFVMNSQKWEI